MDKAKKALPLMEDLCSQTLAMFYLAAASGSVSNKMACIEFGTKVVNSIAGSYSIFHDQKRKNLVLNLNQLVETIKPTIETIELVFGQVLNTLQQVKVIVADWSTEETPEDED